MAVSPNWHVRLPENPPQGWVLVRDCGLRSHECNCCTTAASALFGNGYRAVAYVRDSTLQEGVGQLLYVYQDDVQAVKDSPLSNVFTLNCLPKKEE